MAAWNNGQRTSEIFFNRRRGIAYLQAAMKYSIYFINTNEILNHFVRGIKGTIFKCNHGNSDLFTCEDNLFVFTCEDIMFSRKSSLAFHWCLYNKWKSEKDTREIFEIERYSDGGPDCSRDLLMVIRPWFVVITLMMTTAMIRCRIS